MSKDKIVYVNSADDASDHGLHTEECSKIDVDVAIAIGNDGDGDKNNNNIDTTDDVPDIGNRNGRSAFTRVYRIPNPNFQSPLYDDSNENNINGGVSFDSDTNTNNPHENENNDDMNGNNTRDNILPPPPTNPRVFFWNRRPIPVVQRINGPNNNNTRNYHRGSSELPHAYPVPTVTHSYNISRRRPNMNTDYERNHTDDDIWEDERHQRKLCCKVTLMSGFMTFLGILIFLNIILYVLMFINKSSLSATTDNSTIFTETETSMQSNNSNFTKMMNDSNLAGEKNLSFYNVTEEDNKEKNIYSKGQNKYNYTCYKDPMEIQVLEWDYYERGEDISQKRTYVICPHTFMDIFGYRPNMLEFDHTIGEVKPLCLFLPNFHIKCGLDGSLSNNCTFSGSYFHVIITDEPIFVTYKLLTDIKKENITVEGFRFTGASNGVNILTLAHYTSYTIRNCLFDNNNRMFTSIRVSASNIVDNKAFIDNCTFVNNTYYHNPVIAAASFSGWIPTIAVIMVYPLDPYWNPSIRSPNDPDTMVADLSVSNCVFHNNVFLSKSDTVIAAVINLLPPFTSLSVTDSCFVDNKGYTSGVISISEGDTYIYTSREPSTQFYSGNHFIGNMPKEDHKSSCILSRQYIRFGSDGIPERSELQEECEEYDDTIISGNMVCF